MQSEFQDFVLRKKIIGRETEKEKLIQKTIGKADQMQGKFKILTDSQFNKIFAKALLKGAIANIFEYIKFLQNHDNDVNPQGQLLKVLQFQRDLLLGGLQSRHDVNGIDAAKLALELKQLQDRYPKDFRSKYVDKVDFGGIMNYIEKEQKNLQSLKLTAKQTTSTSTTSLTLRSITTSGSNYNFRIYSC